MNIERYIKKSNSSKHGAEARQKNCLECGKKLENQGTHFWFQGFCSEECKENYLEDGKYR